ncbi:MAG: hypothetical protein ABH842_05080 [Candidatus Micrarchaeota archaeon]
MAAPTVEHKIIPPGKKLPQNVEILAGKVKSITLVLPLLNEKNAYLVIKLPESVLKDVLEHAAKLPEAQRTQFVQDWLMKNQDVALQQYIKSKAKVFTLDVVPVRVAEPSRLGTIHLEKAPHRIGLERGETRILSGSGTTGDPYQATIAVSPFVRLEGVGKKAVKLPLIIDLESFGQFHFKITLKLGQLAEDNISVTSGSISFLLRQQITKLASTQFDTETRDFREALRDAMSNIAPNLREQVKRMKVKHPEWTDCLEGN